MSDNPKHILAIRLSSLGDVAMTVPVFQAVRKTYPKLKLTVLSRGFFKPLFEGIEDINFYEADVKIKHRGIGGLWKLSGELMRLKPDAVADLHNVLRSKVLGLFFRLRGLNTVVLDKGRSQKAELTREKDKNLKPLTPTVERYAQVFEKLGYPIDMSKNWYSPKRELPVAAHKIIGEEPLKWIGVAPFAAFPGKVYPPDLMEEVIKRLSVSGDYKILLFGGGREEARILEGLAQQYDRVESLVNRFSFSEELAVISNLDLMIAMDSGNAHMAAMFGVPVVTLWGVTHPYLGFAPYGQPESHTLLADREQYPLIPTSVYGNKLPEGYEDVMRTISPDSVVKKVEEVVSN
ncbi:glycosyltransferase family 9 protein [Robertkochia aurantiaca]|uniref:glycosyltransferase family 9 protein n=1 Tax=Robertkochia aurantiaca TaxID=2873700 RepID=UPI001CCC4D45|nr:glycosyltransferase family 9 protein [Robertkochia sp. 3YJGBD-33]